MKYVCDAPGAKTWFRIETEAEAILESRAMNHAVEKHFRRAYEQADQSYRPAPGPYVEQDIGRGAHIRRVMPVFLRQIKELGFAGVQNFPTVGLFDGIFRANLEETGMGYGLEVAMIRQAHAFDLLTCPYVFSPDEARTMAAAGADVLVPHMGLTTSGTIGAQTAMTLDDAVARVQEMRDAAVAVRPDVLVLCHGGPIAEPDDAAYVLNNTKGVVGFFGASSMERLPTEVAITDCARRFKSLKLN